MFKINYDEMELVDHVIHINRVAKVVKGGRRFSFSALVVVGDQNGYVGIGMGKAKEVPEAIRKGVEQAKKSLIKVPIVNETVPYKVIGKYGAGRVMIMPASEGTGIIAGGAIRAIMEAAGINNVLTKCLRSNNPHNVSKATIQGLMELRDPEEIARKRGKKLADIRS
ncbi:30S ribosomal protein S5 [Thermodesulfobacteriota bacterium]